MMNDLPEIKADRIIGFKQEKSNARPGVTAHTYIKNGKQREQEFVDRINGLRTKKLPIVAVGF